MKVTIFYVGSSLLAPLRQAERDINARYGLNLRVACHNCTLPLADAQWALGERDLADADIVFVIHITENENAGRIGRALDEFRSRHHAVIVINCLRELMQRTLLGKLALFAVFDSSQPAAGSDLALRFLRKLGSWMAGHSSPRRPNGKTHRPERYLKLIQQTPAILRFVPSRGTLGRIKHYLALFCYFLQPTPANIRSMILYAIQHYVPGYRKRIHADPPESRPAVGIYHPDAPSLFPSFRDYRKWYMRRPARSSSSEKWRLDPDATVGLLLLRPQIVSGAHRHYDHLIRALEAEGLSVIPVLSTFMDNREACQAFLVDPAAQSPRISQLLSLTGFSFVGGPAMNDSKAAIAYLKTLNRPLRSAVSLEMQRTEDWAESMIGLNPVQTAMQVAIPEIDGATEPFIYGGMPAGNDQPQPLEDRCRRLARRVTRWNRLRRMPRSDVRLGAIIYCFPPNKGNLGTAADLDVFPSLWEILQRLQAEGYSIEAPATPDLLREMLLGGSNHSGHLASVAYRLSADEYYRLCPYVDEIEAEWGPTPGRINTEGRNILIHGIELGNLFLGVQPTFGYEGDPMRLLFAKGGAPHHGFMGLYTYLDKIFRADALVHVGTHGALEFMPGKQVGLSESCWPDRLIGEFPNIYIYSVNNPSEGSIAKRRSYAELISYLTPPIENAGLYKELASLKELLGAYRQTRDEKQRERLFIAIQEKAGNLNLKECEPANRI
jgi:magnesium chelatase subunit H